MHPVVVGELRQWQPLSPVVLMVVDEDPEILLDLLVDPLSLSISLRVVCRGEVSLNVQ